MHPVQCILTSNATNECKSNYITPVPVISCSFLRAQPHGVAVPLFHVPDPLLDGLHGPDFLEVPSPVGVRVGSYRIIGRMVSFGPPGLALY